MATTLGQQQDSVVAQEALNDLVEHGYQYDFFYALRLLESRYPDKPRIATNIKAQHDLVNLSQEVSLGFAASAMGAVRWQGDKLKVANRFFGLLGVNGPLPVHLTEHALHRRGHQRDDTFAAFLDIFNHRLTGLLYRAWANCQPTVSMDRIHEDKFSHYLGCLSGQVAHQRCAADQVDYSHGLYFSGLLANQTKSADSLAAVLNDMLGVPVQIHGFEGEWLGVPSENRLRLGDAMQPAILGVTTSLGNKVWERQGKIAIEIGPLTAEQYHQLLPDTETLRLVKKTVQQFTGHTLAYDFQFNVQQNGQHGVRLGKVGQLGWTSWLGGTAATSSRIDKIKVHG